MKETGIFNLATAYRKRNSLPVPNNSCSQSDVQFLAKTFTQLSNTKSRCNKSQAWASREMIISKPAKRLKPTNKKTNLDSELGPPRTRFQMGKIDYLLKPWGAVRKDRERTRTMDKAAESIIVDIIKPIEDTIECVRNETNQEDRSYSVRRILRTYDLLSDKVDFESSVHCNQSRKTLTEDPISLDENDYSNSRSTDNSYDIATVLSSYRHTRMFQGRAIEKTANQDIGSQYYQHSPTDHCVPTSEDFLKQPVLSQRDEILQFNFTRNDPVEYPKENINFIKDFERNNSNDNCQELEFVDDVFDQYSLFEPSLFSSDHELPSSSSSSDYEITLTQKAVEKSVLIHSKVEDNSWQKSFSQYTRYVFLDHLESTIGDQEHRS